MTLVKETTGQRPSRRNIMNKFIFDTIEAPIEYACVHDPVNKYQSDEKEFKVTLLLDDNKQKEMLKLFSKYNVSENVVNPSTAEVMPRIRAGDDGLGRLTLRRNSKFKSGKDAFITVEDAAGSRIPSSIKIGNGSTAVVEMMITTNPKTGKGALKLSGLQVVELVRFEQKSHFKKRKGFTLSEDDLAALNEEGNNAVNSLSDDQEAIF